jgi:hypothetical protein
VAVVLRPALLGVVLLIERVDLPLGMARRQADRGGDVDDASYAFGVVGRQDRAPERRARKANQHGPVGVGGIHDGQRVAGELVLDIRGDPAGPAGTAEAAAVEREHAAMPRKVGDLHLLVPGVDDRSGRQREDGRLARPVELVVELDAVQPVAERTRLDAPASHLD